jgi:hypothetical protein
MLRAYTFDGWSVGVHTEVTHLILTLRWGD